VTRRRRRSKSYAHERWLTTYYFFKNQARGCTPAGAKPVTAEEAFRLRLHAMRIRDHALPPTQNYDTSFLLPSSCVVSLGHFPSHSTLQIMVDTYCTYSTLTSSPSLAALKKS
jgi:hypothetical protein